MPRLMWLFWLLVFGAILAAASLFAFPPAIPVLAIVVFVACVLTAPLALRAARSKVKKDDDGMTRNWRGEVTDFGYLDKERKVPRTQRAVFFGTPQWERYKREKGLAASRDETG
jgi:membrane protein implicated in regulation of membrane protease activity